MSKSNLRKPFAAGLALLLGVAAFSYLTYIPSYVMAEETNPNPANADVVVTVANQLTLSLNKQEISIAANAEKVMSDKFTASVISTSGYTLSLSTANATTAGLVRTNNDGINDEIPAVASNAIVAAGTGVSSWGMRACKAAGDSTAVSYLCTESNNTTDGNPYKAIGFNNNLVKFYENTTATGADTARDTDFEVGIAVTPDQNSGTYATDVTVTLAAI